MSRSPKPPFELGDRVDHPKFGLSTVCEPAQGGPIVWKITIQPDEPGSSPKPIAHNERPGEKQFLKLISSPEERGERYWRLEWMKLLADFDKKSVAKKEFLHSAFRNKETSDFFSELQRLRTEEEEVELQLIAFMRREEKNENK